MAKRRAKTYSPEFCEEVLRLAANSELSDAEIERDLGSSQQLIPQWRARYSVPVGEPDKAMKPATLSEAEEEIRRLRARAGNSQAEARHLKKSGRHFLEGSAAMRYGFIRANQEEFDVKTMCRALEVSRSGY